MYCKIVLAVTLAFACFTANASEYQVSKKIPLPGEGGWDYLTVDENARRLYVSHATQVVVLDIDSLEIVGSISGLSGVHGIALAPEFGRGFITSGQSGTVAVFDLKTLQKIGEVIVGRKPDAIVYDPATKRIFAMNGDSGSSTAINAADSKILGTVMLGGGPESTIADGNGNVFVNLEDKSELLRIDAKTLQVRDRWPVAPCQAPSSMAFDEANGRLFLGCRNRLMAIVDSQNGKVIGTYPIGDKVDASAFEPATKIVFSSTGDGHLYRFHQDSPDSYSALKLISTAPGSKTMNIDKKTQRLFVPAREDGKVALWVLQP
jgi:DNA-binding beta-propeller fold protein YncE